MKRFAAGIILGLILGVAGSAVAARVIGDGYLLGWTVEVNGNEVCSDPYVWSATRQIECD